MNVLKVLSPLVYLIGLPLATLPVRADDHAPLSLSEVLSRHTQALGGVQALALPSTQRVVSDEQTNGLRGTSTTVFKAPNRFYAEEKLGVYNTTFGYDGQTGWQRDGNGSVRLLSRGEMQKMRDDLYLATYSYLFSDRLPGRVTLRPQTERKTGNYILDCLPDGGKPMALYLDPRTFLLVKEQHPSDDLTMTTTYADYRNVGGVLVPGTQRSSDGNRKYDQITTLTRIENGVDAPDSLFALPRNGRNYQWSDPKAAQVIVPFDGSDHRINLYVGINGEPASVILDSGDSDLSLSRQASDYLKLARAGALEGRGYGGSTNTYPVRLDTFELPDAIAFHGLTATAIDLPDFFDFGAATPTVGFLGYPLLSQLVVQLDYAQQHIVLHNPDTWTPTPKDGVALPLEIEDNVPNVEAQFEGLPPARFLIDTGDSGCVRLYTPFVARHGLAEKYPKGMDVWSEGVGGANKARRVRAQSVTVAGVTLTGVPTDMALDAKGGASRFLAGAFGNDFLSHFTVTFDYPHQRVFFAPNAQTNKPFDLRTFGIEVIKHPEDVGKPKRRLLIVWVDHNSPAFKAGLTPGEELVKVDGQSAIDLGLGEVRRLLSSEGGQDTRRLTVIGVEGGQGDVKVSLYDPMPANREAKQ